MRLGTHSREEVRQRMAGLSGADAHTAANSLAAQWHVSINTIYNVSRDVRPARKRRDDAGKSIPIDDAVRWRFLHLTSAMHLSTPVAAEILAEEGHKLPSLSTLNRLLRAEGISKRELALDLRPIVHFEAERPNQLWQMDSSGSTMFYAADDGSIFCSPLKGGPNKPPRAEPRIWMIVIIDDFSRALYAELVPANDTQWWLATIAHAAAEKDATFPFCGLPDEIYTDNDSSSRSKRFLRIMGMFDPPVRVRFTMPYAPRGKGKVEAVIGTIKEQYERRFGVPDVPHLARHVAPVGTPTHWRSLAEANEHLRAWLVQYNNRAHSSTGASPFSRWASRISADAIRIVPPEKLNAWMLMDSLPAKIARDLSVGVNGKRYQLPRREPCISMVGQTIGVWWSPEWPASVFADVGDNRSYEINPIGQALAAGEFRAIEMPKRERTKLALQAREEPRIVSEPAKVLAKAPKWVVGRPALASVPDAPTPSVALYDMTRARIWLVENGFFHRPPRDYEIAAFDAFFAGKTDVSIVDLRRWAALGFRRAAPAAQAAGGAA